MYGNVVNQYHNQVAPLDPAIDGVTEFHTLTTLGISFSLQLHNRPSVEAAATTLKNELDNTWPFNEASKNKLKDFVDDVANDHLTGFA